MGETTSQVAKRREGHSISSADTSGKFENTKPTQRVREDCKHSFVTFVSN